MRNSARSLERRSDAPKKEEKQIGSQKGVDEWLLEDETLSGLREKLAGENIEKNLFIQLIWYARKTRGKMNMKTSDSFMESNTIRT